MIFPELVVFDLDFTLWDCGGTWCDCLRPPFLKVGEQLYDSSGRLLELYPDVLAILDDVDDLGLPMALASRTERPDWARELLALFGIADRFAFQEIYPGSKVKHLKKIADISRITLEKMLFFDDEYRNLVDLEPLGVRCQHVAAGMTEELFSQGLELFA